MGNRADTFDRSDDASSLGTPSDAGSAWSALNGTWGISSNTGYCAGSASPANAVVESSLSDVDIQYTASTASGNHGHTFRATDANNHIDTVILSGYQDFSKYESGSRTILASTGSSIANGDVLRVRALGTSLKLFKNGVEILSTTSSFNQTATKHGLSAFNSTTPRWNDFSITSLAEFTIDKTSVLTGSGTVVLTLTGVGTSWTGSPFSLTGTPPTGWSIASQNVVSSTSATVTLNRGTGTGTITVSDGTLTDTVAATDTATSVQNGDWDDTATWDSAIVPVAGNKAVIAHNVNADSAVGIGTSPAEGTTVLTIQSGKTLLVEAGHSLTVAGDIDCSGVLQVGEAGGGATLEFDASAASSPSSQQYKLQLNALAATLRTRGTTGSHSVVRSNSGGGNAYTVGGVGKGLWDCEWTDFLRIGDANNGSIDTANNTNPGSPTTWVALTDCTFDACGRVYSSLSFPSNATFSLVRVRFTNSAHAGDSARLIGGASNVITTCSFDKGLYTTPSTCTISGWCFFGAGIDHADDATWLDIENCVFWKDDVDDGAFTIRGNISDSYFWCGGTDNPHFPLPRDVGSEKTVSGSVFEYGGGLLTDTGNIMYGGGDWVAERCIILPSQVAATASGAFTFAAIGLKLVHCTLYSSDYSGGILIGDGGAETGMYPQVQSCLFWVESSVSGAKASHTIGVQPDNCITPGNCTHNGMLNMHASPYEGVYPTTQPGANDVTASEATITNAFVDPYRNVATWAVTQGSVSGTYDGKVADAKAYLLADPTLGASLLAHVQAGARPKLEAFRDAGHDGADIGAVEMAEPATGNRRRRLLICGRAA